MLRYKNRKRLCLIDDTLLLSNKQPKIIKKTVYHNFMQEILPYFQFYISKYHFHSGFGRPIKDLQPMLGLFIIEALMGLTDVEAIEIYCFQDTARHSLGLRRDAYLAERTYYSYHSKLLGEDHEVFEQVLERIGKRLNLEYGIQRKDSTFNETHLKQKSRLELFRTTIQLFL